MPRRGDAGAIGGLCLLVAGLVAAPSLAAASPAELPLRYGGACAPVPGDPDHVTVRDAPKGVTVTFERADLGRLDTRDVNLAFVSRRLFFKLRTDTELIEFQGRAADDRLEGMLSDEHGTRRVVFPRETAQGDRGCPPPEPSP